MNVLIIGGTGLISTGIVKHLLARPRPLRLPSRRRCLLVNQARHVRWWYRLLFREVRIEPIGREYWAQYFWRALGGEPEAFTPPRLAQPWALPAQRWAAPRAPSCRQP